MSLESLKKQAKNLLRLLPGFVQQNSTGLQLAHCQELVAQVHGYPNWHAATKRLSESEPSVAPQLDAVDKIDSMVTQADGKTVGRLPGAKLQIEMDGTSDRTRTAMVNHLRELWEANASQAAAHEEGVPALKRLFDIAHGNSGQCRYVAAFILGLYNGARFPFDLTDLRGVDAEIFADCMRVLRMDSCARKEVHTYFENGGDRFNDLAAQWQIADVRRLKIVCTQLQDYGAGYFGSQEKLSAEIRHAMMSTWPK